MQLLGKSDDTTFINPPFYCDYGTHIEVGKNFYANYNCTMLDVGRIRIGDNTVIGAGSVVTRDIPSWSVAAGNPCRVIREITEDDRRRHFAIRAFRIYLCMMVFACVNKGCFIFLQAMGKAAESAVFPLTTA